MSEHGFELDPASKMSDGIDTLVVSGHGPWTHTVPMESPVAIGIRSSTNKVPCCSRSRSRLTPHSVLSMSKYIKIISQELCCLHFHECGHNRQDYLMVGW